MDLVHSPERVAGLRTRSADVHADLVLPSLGLPSNSDLQAGGALRFFVREFTAHDADGEAIGVRRERVNDVDLDGELCPAMITILDVRRGVLVVELDEEDAKACGYRTAARLRMAWGDRHPRSLSCSVVSFMLGDVRDRPIFLQWSGRAGGDYTMSPSRALDDAEALTQEQMAALANWNRQKDEGKRARASRELAAETPSQRWKRLQRVVALLGEDAARAIRQEQRIIDQRLSRAERRVR